MESWQGWTEVVVAITMVTGYLLSTLRLMGSRSSLVSINEDRDYG